MFHVGFVAEDLEVVGREALGVALLDRLFVLPIPHLDGEVLPAELFEREFAEVASAFGGDVIGILLHGLVVGAFTVDVIRGVEVHCFDRQYITS